jgi:hypothetical protein
MLTAGVMLQVFVVTSHLPTHRSTRQTPEHQPACVDQHLVPIVGSWLCSITEAITERYEARTWQE